MNNQIQQKCTLLNYFRSHNQNQSIREEGSKGRDKLIEEEEKEGEKEGKEHKESDKLTEKERSERRNEREKERCNMNTHTHTTSNRRN